MALLVNLRHLEAHNLNLEGEMSPSELDIDTCDELIRMEKPVRYDLEVQQIENGILVEGSLEVELKCQCVRCLKEFLGPFVLDPWTLHVPLSGEDAVPVTSDCVDLTPFIREDILLEFPQHPLCEAECRGLPGQGQDGAGQTSKAGRNQEESSAWAELNKLKFK